MILLLNKNTPHIFFVTLIASFKKTIHRVKRHQRGWNKWNRAKYHKPDMKNSILILLSNNYASVSSPGWVFWINTWIIKWMNLNLYKWIIHFYSLNSFVYHWKCTNLSSIYVWFFIAFKFEIWSFMLNLSIFFVILKFELILVLIMLY